MTRTTPPRPADVAAVFPRLGPLARTATRLHPRPGSPSRQDSSVGGPLLWPSAEPWPHCEGTHWAPDVLPATSPADVRLLREIRSAATSRPPEDRFYTPDERAVVARINAGHPCPAGPVALLPVAQLYVREVPDLRPPEGADLLQVLWCPFDHPGEIMPRTELFWRSAAAVGGVLTMPPEPAAMQHRGYLPEPCLLSPEQITEYPLTVELEPDLCEEIEAWSVRQKAGELPGSAYEGMEEMYYDRELAVSPGWKVGGWAPWSFTDPTTQHCRVCDSPMEPMLTIASREQKTGIGSWTPLEDQAAAASSPDAVPPDPTTPTQVTIGDAHHQQIYACPASPEHPHTALVQ
ncbi:hypothetical protein [Streptomyces sp. NPDC048650]|uniref:hypothetical protein n=1 Tax=Streptomyces sp. NPDC048650 TaxID=3365583 RepID=UPI0037233E32